MTIDQVCHADNVHTLHVYVSHVEVGVGEELTKSNHAGSISVTNTSDKEVVELFV